MKLSSNGQTVNRLAKPPPEEPDALVAHVRVCEGGGSQDPFLLGKVVDTLNGVCGLNFIRCLMFDVRFVFVFVFVFILRSV